MTALLGYIYLGISLSAPVGPINAAQMEIGLRKGFWHAWIFGLGALAADLFYMLLVYFGLSTVLEIPLLKTFLWLFGSFVLLYTGAESLISNFRPGHRNTKDSMNKLQSWRTGFLMSVSNPLSILFWLGIYGSVIAKSSHELSTEQTIINSCAIIAGVFIWDIILAMLSGIFRNFLTSRLLAAVSLISGLSLIGFGIYFGVMGILSLL